MILRLKGSSTSGNYGHAGIPGHVGGSRPRYTTIHPVFGTDSGVVLSDEETYAIESTLDDIRKLVDYPLPLVVLTNSKQQGEGEFGHMTRLNGENVMMLTIQPLRDYHSRTHTYSPQEWLGVTDDSVPSLISHVVAHEEGHHLWNLLSKKSAELVKLPDGSKGRVETAPILNDWRDNMWPKYRRIMTMYAKSKGLYEEGFADEFAKYVTGEPMNDAIDQWFTDNIRDHEFKERRLKGGSGSGNYGHEGIPGHLGGSAPSSAIEHAPASAIEHAPASIQNMSQYRTDAINRLAEWRKDGMSDEQIARDGYKWRQWAHKNKDAWNWAMWEKIQGVAKDIGYEYKAILTDKDVLDDPTLDVTLLEHLDERYVHAANYADELVTRRRNTNDSGALIRFLASDDGKLYRTMTLRELWGSVVSNDGKQSVGGTGFGATRSIKGTYSQFPDMQALIKAKTFAEALDTTITVYRGIGENYTEATKRLVSYTTSPEVAKLFAEGYVHSYNKPNSGAVVSKTIKFGDIALYINMDYEYEILLPQRIVSKEHHTTAMIAFDLSNDMFANLTVLDDDVRPEHITLLYLGDNTDLDKDVISKTLEDFAKTHAPVDGAFGGFAVFPASVENDNKSPVVALYDSPQLPAFRQALLHAFDDVCQIENTHGFTPHMTIKYTDVKDVKIPTSSVTAPKTMKTISLFWGDEIITFPLSGNIVEKGGEGSGNFGHEGRPGLVGGSAEGVLAADPGAGRYIVHDSMQAMIDKGKTGSLLGFWVAPNGDLLSPPNINYGDHDYMAGQFHRDPTYSKYFDNVVIDANNRQRYETAAIQVNFIRVEYSDMRGYAGKLSAAASVRSVSIESKHIDKQTLHRLQALLIHDIDKLTWTSKADNTTYTTDDFHDFMTYDAVHVKDGDVVFKELPIGDQSKANLIDIRGGIFNDAVDTLAEKLYSGDISIGAWEEQMKAEIKALHTATASIGKGSWDQMTNSDWGRVGQLTKEQYRYLHGFAENIAENRDTLSLQAIQARAHMYGSASKHTAAVMQAGEFAGGTRRKPGRFTGLPWIPKDFTTECRMNCKCTWVLTVIDQTKTVKLVQAVWTLHPAEHCTDCIDRRGHTEILSVPLDTVVPSVIGGY